MGGELAHRIAAARGLRKADLVLKSGRLVDVFSGEIYTTDVAIVGARIAGLGTYRGRREIDVRSKYILPGFIDSHVHIESSMLTPPEFARAALPHGTTAVVADPHEIANVLGKQGLRFMLSASEGLPLDFYFMLPSCVPASSLETSGARLSAADLLPLLKHPRVLGLGEMMDYPGVIERKAEVLRKLEAFSCRVIDGHAPGLSGRDLNAYAGAGISSDHECITAAEARSKIRAGMTVFIREGSAAKDLARLVPAVNGRNSRCFTLATDDFHADDLQQGNIDRLVRKAIRLGLDPVTAIRMATINAAQHFGLRHKGAVLPGYDADLLVVDNLRNLAVEQVIKSGRLAAERGRCRAAISKRHRKPVRAGRSIRARPIGREDLYLRAKTGRARVIELIPDEIETRTRILPVRVEDGFAVSDPAQDIVKLVVIERHHYSGNVGIGLLRGMGLKRGALASTVAHDSHNIIACGVTDQDILAAVSRLHRIGGGLVTVNRGMVLAELPLPIAGLMSDRPLAFVVQRLEEIRKALAALGTPVLHPFGVLSFLALPVIPDLKLTDRGLVDVKKFKITELFV